MAGAGERVIADTISYKGHWKVHGWLGFAAWGFLVPFAINASLLRDYMPTKGLCFKLHQLFNGIAYILSLAMMAVAVYYVEKEGTGHFNSAHEKMGLSIVSLASVQVLGGIIRPPKPNSLNSHTKTPAKRTVFEVCHRILGSTLLLCAFWQMQSGLHVCDTKFSIQYKGGMLSLYWLWVPLICIVTSLSVCLRWRKREPPWWHTTDESEHLSAHLLQ